MAFRRLFAFSGFSFLALAGLLPAEEYNVLFIAADDLRPELGCYGVPVVKSPNIDRLASQGLLFDRAYCQQAVCNPSRVSLLTGLRPDTTRIYTLPAKFRDELPDVVTLPQYFRNHGYFTIRVGKIFHTGHGNSDDTISWTENRNLPEGAKYGKPGKAILEKQRAEQGNNRYGMAGPLWEAVDGSDEALSDGVIADHAIRLLNELKDRRFFLGVGFKKPHLPFIAPKKYFDLYAPDEIPPATNPFAPQGSPPYAHYNSRELRAYYGVPEEGPPLRENQPRELKHAYYACVSYIDACLGRILAELDRLDLRRKTIVIFWGDHGWQLGEHDLWGKDTNYETSARVPLIISVPGQQHVGVKTDALVEFVDIYPTLVDLCGLPMPSGLEGLSFRPLLENPDRDWKTAAFSQFPREIPEAGEGMGRTIRTDRYRLIEWAVPGTNFVNYELYDHQSDPDENVNLADRPENRQRVQELVGQLHAGWRAALPR